MQKQTTIFGAEKDLTVKNKMPSERECAALSEKFNRPVFIPGRMGRGLWITSVKPGAWVRAGGNKMGINGVVKAVGVDMNSGFAQEIAVSWAPGVIGTCLMDGKALEVLPSPPDSINFKAFGVMGTSHKTFSIPKLEV